MVLGVNIELSFLGCHTGTVKNFHSVKEFDWKKSNSISYPMWTRVEVSPLKIAKRCEICGEFE